MKGHYDWAMHEKEEEVRQKKDYYKKKKETYKEEDDDVYLVADYMHGNVGSKECPAKKIHKKKDHLGQGETNCQN